MLNLLSYNFSKQLISVLNYENKKDNSNTEISCVNLNQVSSNTRNNIFMNLSYICGYKGKTYKCLSDTIII